MSSRAKRERFTADDVGDSFDVGMTAGEIVGYQAGQRAMAEQVEQVLDGGPDEATGYEAGLDDGRRERGAMFELVARAIEFGDDLTEIAEMVGVFREGTPHAVDVSGSTQLVDEVEAFLREQTD
jgi:hypothetical protein